MKKFILPLFILAFFISNTITSQTLNCNYFCVLSINNLDTTANTLDVTILNNDTNQVNYPTVVVTDAMGDTVANINNQFYYFAQMDSSTLVHTIPTTLNSIPSGFTGTVYITDRIWDLTCSFAFPMTCSTGINETQLATNTISVFPNPSSDIINIGFSNKEWETATISVMDYTGKKVNVFKPQSSLFTFNKGDLSAGMYFIITETAKGRHINKLMIK